MPKRLTLPCRAGLALLALALGACVNDDPIAGIPRGAADGLYPQLVASTRGASTEVRLSLLSKPAGLRYGSFQGELTYDAAVLTFESATLAEGVDGVVHSAAPGRLRFVGTALDGVAQVPLVTVRFARKGTVAAEGLGVAFEEVTAAADLTDLTAAVQATPLVTLR